MSQVRMKREKRQMKLLLKKICEVVIVEGGSKHNFFTIKMLREILFRVTSKNEARKTLNETVAKKKSVKSS